MTGCAVTTGQEDFGQKAVSHVLSTRLSSGDRNLKIDRGKLVTASAPRRPCLFFVALSRIVCFVRGFKVTGAGLRLQATLQVEQRHVETRIIAILTAVLLVACGSETSAPHGASKPDTLVAQTEGTLDERAIEAKERPAPGSPATTSSLSVQRAEGDAGAAADTSQLVTAQAAASRFEAGVHYHRLSPPQPTSTDADQIEVAEIFMYSCPGCYGIAPYFEQWTKTKPDYVNLVRIPAQFHRIATLHAQAYYTAEALGKIEEMHSAFFTEFHVNNNALDSEDLLRQFFARFGVSEQAFDSAWNSFSVRTRMTRGRELAGRYSVGETPTVVVQGKYLITGRMAGTYQSWFEIIDTLAALEYVAANSD